MTHRYRFSFCLIFTISHRLMSSLSARSNALKNIIKPELIPIDYWEKIIWTAKDLKQAVSKNEKKSLEILETKHVTLLFIKPHGRFQLAYTLACDLLGARRTLYYDPNFENQSFPGDSAKVLSSLTDLLVIHGLHHEVLIKMVSSATVPVFSTSCDVYYLQKALSDLMTYHEQLNRLKGLKLAWVGPPNSTFNAYLVLCSKFGINIQYICVCSHGTGKMSPVHRFENEDRKDSLKEFKTVMEVISGAHIIATSMHPEENNRITPELIKNADPNCVFMHSLPRSSTEVSDEVFNRENNLSWKTSENYLYIAMAVILTSLQEYHPKSNKPDFDGVNKEQNSSSSRLTEKYSF